MGPKDKNKEFNDALEYPRGEYAKEAYERDLSNNFDDENDQDFDYQ